MGGTDSKPEADTGPKAANGNNNSVNNVGGFHLLELHAGTLGGCLFILVIGLLVYVGCKKCAATYGRKARKAGDVEMGQGGPPQAGPQAQGHAVVPYGGQGQAGNVGNAPVYYVQVPDGVAKAFVDYIQSGGHTSAGGPGHAGGNPFSG